MGLVTRHICTTGDGCSGTPKGHWLSGSQIEKEPLGRRRWLSLAVESWVVHEPYHSFSSETFLLVPR